MSIILRSASVNLPRYRSIIQLVNHPLSTYAKVSEKEIILAPLTRTCTWACQVIRNVIFPENFAYVIKGNPDLVILSIDSVSNP